MAQSISIRRQWIWICMVVVLAGARAFTQRAPFNRLAQRSSSLSRRYAAFDPVELANAAANTLQHLLHPDPGDTANHHGFLEAVLTTLYSADVSALKPAHEHTQPLWGPPDPYLSAWKSIAPSTQALTDMGVQNTATATKELDQLQTSLVKEGFKVLDANRIQAENVLPGFSPAGGFLPGHDPRVPAETRQTFVAQIEWSWLFLNVFDKLPFAAFNYALVEFFFLRPGLDTYKEDIEEEPSQALAETVSVTSIRMGMFVLVSILTVFLFG